MIKSKKLRIPIYGGSYTLILWDDDTELQEKFKSFKFDPPIQDFDGGVFRRNDKDYLVLKVYKNKRVIYPTPGIIAHECKHVVNSIFLEVHQELDRYNDEAECYLLGWLVNRVHEFVNKNIESFKIK